MIKKSIIIFINGLIVLTFIGYKLKLLNMPSSLKQQEFDRQLDLMQIREYCRTDNLEILGRLYHKYMHLVFGLGLKYFKDREMAGDLVMQIFEKLTVDVKKQDISNFRSWLYVVSKNQCLMEIRKANAEDARFKRWQEEEKKNMESGVELHPLDDGSKVTDALRSCIEKLKDDQKQCIDLFYFKSKSYREISVSLSLEENKVKSYIQNGKRNIKICLESHNVREY